MVLDAVWSAVRDARLTPLELTGRRTGAFFPRELAALGGGTISAHLARVLGLRGPVDPVPGADGATAALLAVRSLGDGESDVALLGGAGRGEHDVLVLCRLADAFAAGRRVYAEIGGTGARRAPGEAVEGELTGLLRAVTPLDRGELVPDAPGTRLGLVPSPARHGGPVTRGLLPSPGAPGPPGPPGPPDGSGVAVLFAGECRAWWPTGRELYRHYPVFRKAFDEASAALDVHLPLPLAAVAFAPEAGVDAELIEEPEFGQAVSFACELALFRLWEAWGLRAAAVTGHAAGGLTAAHAAGVLGMEDAARLIVARGRLVRTPARGGSTPGDFLEVARRCRFEEPLRTWICPEVERRSGHGPRSEEGGRSPDYWLRQAVSAPGLPRVADALTAAGFRRQVECGPAGRYAVLSVLGDAEGAPVVQGRR
ncbi:acyltransferase domain-containing protein [Streptomyces sp. NPDC032198]|uniref:acyltransferase domain-containing protein n=1 Tax=Streptomyces sp. NPDC032198 TaxID=3155127 RepID=UPI00340B75BC